MSWEWVVLVLGTVWGIVIVMALGLTLSYLEGKRRRFDRWPSDEEERTRVMRP